VQTYIIKRTLQFVPVILGVTFLVFAMTLLLPGDPVAALLGLSEGQAQLEQDVVDAYRHELGLDRPIPVQYVMWLGRVVRGDFGTSIKTQRPVVDEITPRLKVTAQVSAAAFVVSLLIAFPAGIAGAIWRNTWLDRTITVFAVSAVAVPSFWLAIMLILLFSVKLQWLPPSGFVSPFEDPVRGLKLLVMPVLMLGWEGAAVLTRQTRSSMLEVLNQDYVRTARAKGLAGARVIWLHALKNAMLPIVTIIGLRVGFLLGGTAIVETIFTIPGMGRLFVSSISTRDFPVIQACVLIIALGTVIASLLTDLAYGLLDPRIRFR
jgi:peptide/nickel transport system permease protein